MLAGGGHVELASHLAAEIVEILSHRIETSDGRLPKISEFALHLADIPIGSTSKHTGSGGVLFASPDAPLEVPHLTFQLSHPWLQLARFHDEDATAARECGHPPIHNQPRTVVTV